MRVPRRTVPRPTSGRRACDGRARPRRAALLAGVAAAALAVAGCGAGDDPSDADAAARAATTTVGVTTTTGPTTTGADGARTTPEGMVLPDYADGRPPSSTDAAPCTVAALERAVRADIDVPDRPPTYIDCRERYAVAVVSFGSCPPAEAEPDGPEPVCARRKVAYWKAVGGRWRILTYVPAEDASCAVARRSGEPEFPRSLCVPRTAG